MDHGLDELTPRVSGIKLKDSAQLNFVLAQLVSNIQAVKDEYSSILSRSTEAFKMSISILNGYLLFLQELSNEEAEIALRHGRDPRYGNYPKMVEFLAFFNQYWELDLRALSLGTVDEFFDRIDLFIAELQNLSQNQVGQETDEMRKGFADQVDDVD